MSALSAAAERFAAGAPVLVGDEHDQAVFLATAADIKGTLNVPDLEHPQVNFEMSSSHRGVAPLFPLRCVAAVQLRAIDECFRHRIWFSAPACAACRASP